MGFFDNMNASQDLALAKRQQALELIKAEREQRDLARDAEVASRQLLNPGFGLGRPQSLESEVFGGNQMDKEFMTSLLARASGGYAPMLAQQRAAQAEANKTQFGAPGSGVFRGGEMVGQVPFAPQPTPSILIPGVKEAQIEVANATRAPASNDETWNNPVPEVGPDGKPIQVRYSNRGARQVIEGAVPSKQGNSFDRADYWRSQVKPFADSATNARVQSSKVGASLALGTGTGHIAAINALQKMIDEGAVVRDQDVALIQSAQSFAGRLGAQMETLKSGKILSPELQQELKNVAGSLESAIYQGVNERIGAYEPVMTEEGVKMDSVLPPAMRKMFTTQPAAPPAAKPPGPPPIGKNGRPMKWVSQ